MATKFMDECHFCKEALADGKEFVLQNPDGKVMNLCEGCVSDMLSAFGSGKIERAIITRQDIAGPPKLSIVDSENGPCLAEWFNDAKKYRPFKNVIVKNVASQFKYIKYQNEGFWSQFDQYATYQDSSRYWATDKAKVLEFNGELICP